MVKRKRTKGQTTIYKTKQTNQVECEGTQAQVATARQVHTIKDGLCFTTKEGIRIYVYCAAIEHLEVDVVVNAANKDLQHDEGIAYHISRAAGYDFDKEFFKSSRHFCFPSCG
jgi:hypothetical protein